MLKLITPLNQADTSASFTLGSRTITKDGNEYIYLRGCSGGTMYSLVSYGTNYTAQLVYGGDSTLYGCYALLQGTLDSASKYGWAQIKGTGTALSSGSVVANKALTPSTSVTLSGYVDDSGSGSLFVVGLWSALKNTTLVAENQTVILNYPSWVNVTLS